MTRRFGLLALALSLVGTATLEIDLCRADETRRVGVLDPFGSTTFEEGLRDALRRGGYSEGTNLFIEWRRSSENEEELRSGVSNLVRSNVDLMVTVGTSATRAALQGAALPVVFVSGDPVRAGFASSLSKPGGNGTGVSLLTPELEVKRLELLHQLAPKARRIGYLVNLSHPLAKPQMPGFEAAARTLGVEIEFLDAPDPPGLDVALRALQSSPPEALLVAAIPFYLSHRTSITQVARKTRIPAMYAYREFVADGGLASYGPDLRRVGSVMGAFVVKILRGSKPSELPIEQMSEYELVVNLRVARDQGSKVPQELLLRAEEVIR
jgi:putative tryptophan/tyrosine transport system substrate-binding protein